MNENQSRLIITIGINNDGNLEIVDQTPYEDWISSHEFDADHQVLERIIADKGDDNPTIVEFSNLHGETPEALRHSTSYDVPGNGLYHYQKLVIPTENHADTHENEFLYYTENNKVYFIDSDTQEEHLWDPRDDFDEIYNTVIRYNCSNCFHFAEDSFSMYDLVACYIAVEKERLLNYIKNACAGNCDKIDELNTRADILLAAIMVIQHLIELGDYFEAQRILNGLQTCGKLCAEIQDKLKGCGCGRT